MILKRIKYRFAKFLFQQALSKEGKHFTQWFNVYSKVASRFKQQIYYEDGYYYLKNENWRFFHRKQGLMAYPQGLKNRANSLKESYNLVDFEYAPGDVIIDCGANNGDFYLTLPHNIEYHGLEPSPKVFSNLEHNIQGQHLYNKALWNEKTSLTFFLSDDFGDSSIIEPNKFEQSIEVETLTLDQLIETINKRIKLIKIEAEGAEPEVLQGLDKKIDCVEYITIDVGFERGKNSESTFVPCINYLMNKNFELIDFDLNRLSLLFKNRNTN